MFSIKFNFDLFADDTSILYSHKNIRLEQIVNSELQNVCHWLEANKLTLNIQKSNFVIFHTKKKALGFIPNIKIIDLTAKPMIPLEMKDTFKYLGLLIDFNLTWKSHVDYISPKISRLVNIIARLRHYVPKYTLQKVYHGLMHPYLTYGISIWGQANKTILNPLLILQKRVIRLLNYANYRDHAILSLLTPKYYRLIFFTFIILHVLCMI